MKSFIKISAIFILFVGTALILSSCKKKPTIAVVTTANVSGITQTTATSGGNVTDDGGAEVTARGVCWSTSENPTTGANMTSDGKGTGSFTSSLSMLTPGTKYYVRAYAINGEGTAYGDQVSFSTGAISPPTVVTTIVTSITGTTAASGGNITSDGGGSITARGVCWATTADPTITNDKTNEGSGSGTFTSSITGLTPSTAYHVRAYATNSAGTSYGSDEQFTTLGGKATASTNPASSISSTGATLKGTVAANYSSTTITFEYGKTTSYGQTIDATPATATGNDNVDVSANVTGLEVGMTYHFRVKAVNAGGTAYGIDRSFTTSGGKPYASTGYPSDVTSTSATLKGTVTANYSSTIVTFEYGKTVSYGSTADATPGTITGGNDYIDVIAEITGLEVGTTYHFRVKAVNASGTTYGSDYTLTTLGGKPIAYTSYPSDITSSSATLKGSVAANYSSTTVTFEYGKTVSYGSTADATPGTITGGSADYEDVIAEISGLDVGTTYHVRVKAVNAFGTTYGSDYTFTTLGGKPVAYTSYPSDITSTSVTLKGSVAANYSSTTVTFEYGKTISYGSTADATPGTVTGSVNYEDVIAAISGLEVGTTYHFRVKAVNAFGTTYGSDYTFATLGGKPIAYTSSASDITSTSVTFKGSVAANYSSTTVTFEYGKTVSYGSTADATPGTVTGAVEYVNVIAAISGLEVGTTYHFRVKAVNAFGTTYGTDYTVVTLGGKPSAYTSSATDITSTSVTLKGAVAANYSSTTVTFEYGKTVSYGSTVDATPGTVTGAADYVSVTAAISGLEVGTTYHFRVKAVNAFGTTYGTDYTVVTLGGKPSAYNITPTDITSTSATLKGAVAANYSSTTVTFEYGTTSAYGLTVNATPGTVTGATDYVQVSGGITGLSKSTTYHFRVKAVNSFGTTYGSDLTFTTSATK
jgi:FKBP-type peptidyl-prolyl cis-trans isomerase 2